MINKKNQNVIVNSFLNKILNNFRLSKKIFFTYENLKYFYKGIFVNLEKINFFLSKYKKEKIAIFSDKSIGYYTSVIAVILSGNCWVQISPTIPINKIKKILRFANIQIGIFDNSFSNKKILKLKKIKLLKYDKIINSSERKKFNFKNISPDNCACVFFTSGSSGEPKGVKISFFNLASSVNYQVKNLDYDKNEVFSDYHDASFVMSLTIIFPVALLNCTLSPLLSFADKLAPLDHLKKNKITTLITVPSFILYNKNNLSKVKSKLKNLIICGESFSYKILDLIIKNIKYKNLYNCYGATEISPWAFFYKYKRKDKFLIKKLGKVPIGKAFKNIDCFINKNKELHISGSVISQGYLNNINETSKKFKKINNKIYYNTGDLSFKMKNLFFIKGRNDSLVKIKGYRVDLNEIENTLKKLPYIVFAYCYVKKSGSNNNLILLFNSEEKNKQDQIKKNLKSNLPFYMMPKKIIHINKIKFNKNGKIDRVFLKQHYK